ncbi:MAG: diaminopropionate ammonia-lyase [Candidatus Zixiibacteriota bacterium]
MNGLRFVINNKSRPKQVVSDLLKYFDNEQAQKALEYHYSYSEYTPTPLICINSLAKNLNLNKVIVKDESKRFGLKAFKVLGGSYAIGKYLYDKTGIDNGHMDFNLLQSSEFKNNIGEIVFCTASDGNHGRGVAYIAVRLGYKAVIYLPEGTVPNRIKAISETGAETIVTDGDYDQTVLMARQASEKNDWVLIQDTSWPGYHQIPLWIMQGYLTMVQEIFDQMDTNSIEKLTHIFLQAGVGSMAAAVIGALVNKYGTSSPKIIIIEPLEAACFYESVLKGGDKPLPSEGTLKTIMAGLSCGVPSELAYDIIVRHADYFLACDDTFTVNGMKLLAHPLGDDPPIISGESGAVGAGLLRAIMKNDEYRELRKELKLDNNSSVLLLNTEGDTDPENYFKIVGAN